MSNNSITIKAPAKINLSLDITGRREDGYHLVRMLMQSLSCYDEVTVEAREDMENTMECNIPGLPADGRNLCIKAAKAMQESFGIQHGFHIRLKKQIPMAAGLAGGSTDAAAVMRAICEIDSLDATTEKLQQIALPLGADIPYCIVGGLMLSEGIGEILTELSPLPTKSVLLVKPNVDVSTGTVYKAYDALSEEEIHHPDTDQLLDYVTKGDWDALLRETSNVLEDVTAPMEKSIPEIEKELRECGAKGTMMSGSGPTVFAVYDTEDKMSKAAEEMQRMHPEYEVRMTQTV